MIIESKDNVKNVPQTRNYTDRRKLPISALSPSLWYEKYVWIHSISISKYTDIKEN
jgi:hypothetical protein